MAESLAGGWVAVQYSSSQLQRCSLASSRQFSCRIMSHICKTYGQCTYKFKTDNYLYRKQTKTLKTLINNTQLASSFYFDIMALNIVFVLETGPNI